MRHRDRYRCAALAGQRFRQAFDNGWEIRSGIAEKIIDVAIFQNGEIGFGCTVDFDCLGWHGCPCIPFIFIPDNMETAVYLATRRILDL